MSDRIHSVDRALMDDDGTGSTRRRQGGTGGMSDAALEAENERLRVRVHQLLDCLEWISNLYPHLEDGIEEKLKEAWPIKTQEAYQAARAPCIQSERGNKRMTTFEQVLKHTNSHIWCSGKWIYWNDKLNVWDVAEMEADNPNSMNVVYGGPDKAQAIAALCGE